MESFLTFNGLEFSFEVGYKIGWRNALVNWLNFFQRVRFCVSRTYLAIVQNSDEFGGILCYVTSPAIWPSGPSIIPFISLEEELNEII